MRPFEYQRADSSGAAVAMLKDFEESAILAGGTGLVDLMKEGVSLPSVLVDVSRLNRSAVREEPGSLLPGAGATNTQVAYSDLVERHLAAEVENVVQRLVGQQG